MKKSIQSPAGMSIGLMLLAFIAYISLGLPDGLIGVAWPSIRRSFALNLDSLGVLMMSVTAGYLVSSFFSGRLMAYLKLGKLLAVSTFAAGTALLVYSASPAWWLMVIAGAAVGFGSGGIDASLNTYAASHHGDELMQWLHACYGIGATLGPIIMTTAISMAGSWRWGYLTVGLLQLALTVSFLLTISMWEKNNDTSGASQKTTRLDQYNTSMKSTLSRPEVWLSMALFFIYMGIEVTFGAWSYSLLTESRGVSIKLAGYWVGSFWGIFTIGRIFAGIYTSRIRRSRLIIGSLLAAFIAIFILAANISNPVNLAAITVIGLAIAPVLAALLSGTADRVGPEYAANTIGIQIAAMGIGGAAIPSITGVIAQHFSLEAIPVLMMVLIVVLTALYLLSLKPVKKIS